MIRSGYILELCELLYRYAPANETSILQGWRFLEALRLSPKQRSLRFVHGSL